MGSHFSFIWVLPQVFCPQLLDLPDFGMFVYSELTSSVTSKAPSGILPSCLILLMKCCVSLT